MDDQNKNKPIDEAWLTYVAMTVFEFDLLPEQQKARWEIVAEQLKAHFEELRRSRRLALEVAHLSSLDDLNTTDNPSEDLAVLIGKKNATIAALKMENEKLKAATRLSVVNPPQRSVFYLDVGSLPTMPAMRISNLIRVGQERPDGGMMPSLPLGSFMTKDGNLNGEPSVGFDDMSGDDLAPDVASDDTYWSKK